MLRLSQPLKLLTHQPITEHYDQVQISYLRRHYDSVIEQRLESGTIPTSSRPRELQIVGAQIVSDRQA